MSEEAISNPLPLTQESNTARKKRVKADQAAKAATDPKEDGLTSSASNAGGAGGSQDGDNKAEAESSGDSAYVKELQKNIRNVNKKLNAMIKVDSILAENPDKSLDELVATRKINQDQKAQALKKPQLQSSLSQLEEQIATYKKFSAEFEARHTGERDSLVKSHQEELERVKEETRAEFEKERNAMPKAEEMSRETLRKKLLVFSQFLRAAAAKRAQEEEAESDESKAFEGALLLVYGGDEKAVDAAESLIEGKEEQIPHVDGTLGSVKYSQIREASLAHTPYAAEEAWAEAVADSSTPSANQQATQTANHEASISDPTLAHAGMTELQDTQVNGLTSTTEDTSAPEQTTIDENAGNAAAEKAIAPAEDPMAESFEMVPRDPAETETPHEKAGQGSTNSWADEAATTETSAANAAGAGWDTTAKPEGNGAGDEPSAQPTNAGKDAARNAPPAAAAGEETKAVDAEGFHAVEHRHRGRGGFRGGRGDGEFRGRGRGGYRGRGDGEGRGRGGPRGGPPAPAPAPAPALAAV
ncbi:hypothetical protein LTR66_012672 [Elasticomyces elasticus]|nr:hypothetical protein LTR66_012672 [Elasticomyces elasticus]